MTNTNDLRRIIGEITTMKQCLDATQKILAEVANIKALAGNLKNTETAPGYPEYLTTKDDYASAPKGTIVAEDGEFPAILWSDGMWGIWMERKDHFEMSGTVRRVLRWGWEA